MKLTAKLGHMITYIFITVILLGLGLWLLLLGGQMALSLFSPPAQIALVPAEGTDDEKKLVVTLWAKLRELQVRSIHIPTNYGFFPVPSVASMILQADAPLSTTNTVLEKLDLKIQNVSAREVIKALNGLFAPKHYELRATVTDLSNERIITSRLVLGEEVKAMWSVSSPKKADGNENENTRKTGTEASDVLDDPVDRLLFQMIFTFTESQDPVFNRWRTGGKRQSSDFTNWQSLRDYVRGLGYFRAYQNNLNHKDLNNAIAFLQDLAIQSPNDPYGLYFLGLVLVGDRQDAEAATVFNHLQLLLARKLKGTEPDKEKWNEMHLESRYDEAFARMRLYKRDQAAKAVDILTELISELKNKIHSSEARTEEIAVLRNLEHPLENAKERKIEANISAMKLLLLSYVQLGHTHARMLTFFKSKDAAAIKEFNTHAAELDSYLELAKDKFTELKAWESKADVPKSEQENWPETENFMRMRIRNATGYGEYQKAFQQLPCEANFREKCQAAIDELEQANKAYPNYWDVVQNLGTIYADQHYDPEGAYLTLAQSVFEQTMKWVPRDYYQYEQLAVIHHRKAERLYAPEDIKEEIRQGIAEANNCRKYWPDSRTAVKELARLARMQWEVNGKQEVDGTAALNFFREAGTEFKDEQDFDDEYLSFMTDLGQVGYKPEELVNRVLEFLDDLVPRVEDCSRLKKLENGLSDVASAKGLKATKDRVRLEELKLRVAAYSAKAFWKARGERIDGEEAKTMLIAFRDASATSQSEPGFNAEYVAVIKELGQAGYKPEELVDRIAEFVKNLAQRVIDSSELKKLETQLGEIAKSDGFNAAKERARLEELGLRVAARSAKASWEARGKQNGAEANTVLGAFQKASAKSQNEPDSDDEYVALIKELAKSRENDAAGLNEIVKRLVDLAHSPGRENRKAALKKLAKEYVERSLALITDNTDPLAVDVQELQTQVNGLQ